MGATDRLFLAHPADSAITIVTIDDASIGQLGRWPWPRSIHADLITKLHEAGAKVIGYDVNFPEASDDTNDQALADALKKGPVVLYFFPAAYSEGCSVEAHYFAEAIPEFQALGATVVGVSGDDIDTLSKFSVQACQNKFPVASDERQTVMKSYDAVLKTRPEFANRISYVIAPNGQVVYHYMSLNPTKHVEKMLGALKSMQPAK